MNILGVCAAGAVCAALCAVIRKHNPEQSLLLALCGGCAILIYSLKYAGEIADFITQLGALGGGEYIATLLKITGICIVTELASGICGDAGNLSLSKQIEAAGRIAVVVAALPLFKSAFSVAVGLMER